MEPIEPADPIDRIEPTDPMDRIEPADPIDKMEPLEPRLRIDPAQPCDLRVRSPLCMSSFSQVPRGHRRPSGVGRLRGTGLRPRLLKVLQRGEGVGMVGAQDSFAVS